MARWSAASEELAVTVLINRAGALPILTGKRIKIGVAVDAIAWRRGAIGLPTVEVLSFIVWLAIAIHPPLKVVSDQAAVKLPVPLIPGGINLVNTFKIIHAISLLLT